MNTAEAVTTAVCAIVLALGAGLLVLARQALRDGWVRYSVTFATVLPGKRYGWPKGAAATPPADSAGEASAVASPADPARPSLREAG